MAADPHLRFGLFLAPYHEVGENPTLALERDLELIRRADELGYDEAWVGEHHSTGWETIAARWSSYQGGKWSFVPSSSGASSL